jgi:hypothetical protein
VSFWGDMNWQVAELTICSIAILAIAGSMMRLFAALLLCCFAQLTQARTQGAGPGRPEKPDGPIPLHGACRPARGTNRAPP